jgi:SAM-dependent methyltransferase
MKLNLGCSDAIHPDFLNVDIWTPPGVESLAHDTFLKAPKDGEPAPDWAGKFFKADLSKNSWPFPDSSVDLVRAHDIVEHLPSKVKTMNNIHRILKPGGLAEIFVPTTDGRGAFQDPTHVSFWTPNDFFYYCDYYAEWIRFHEAYGITARFRIQDCANSAHANAYLIRWHTEYPGKVTKLKIVLEAVK